MKQHARYLTSMIALSLLLAVILGCAPSAKGPAWTKGHKVAGKEQRLSHLAGLVVDDKFAFVMMGGTIADQNEGNSGLRKIALDSGAVTTMDDGKNFPQTETGGIALDDHFVYWNGGGKILRLPKEGGKAAVVAAENVGIGIDMAVDQDKVYWANHGYYSPNSPTKPSPIYVVSKTGGKAEIFADQQRIPNSLVIDDKYLYWLTAAGLFKQAKAGGQIQTVYQITDREGVDKLAQDSESLYFGFRGAGESRWALRKISKQGSGLVTLVAHYSLKEVVVDEANAYFFDEDGMTADVFCKIPKIGGPVSRLDSGYASGVIAQNKTQVYIGALDDIYAFAK